jgi:hypothetical protein
VDGRGGKSLLKTSSLSVVTTGAASRRSKSF